MDLLVGVECVLGVGHKVALVALDRLLPRVGPEVDGELVGAEKLPVADPALEVLLGPLLPLHLQLAGTEFDEALPDGRQEMF